MAAVLFQRDFLTRLPDRCIFRVCKFLLGERATGDSDERTVVLSSRVSKAWNLSNELVHARGIAKPELERKIFEAKIQTRNDYPRDLFECFSKGGCPIYRMPEWKPERELEMFSPEEFPSPVMRFKTKGGMAGISMVIRAESPSKGFERRVELGLEKRLVNVVFLVQRFKESSEWMNTWGKSLNPEMRALFDKRHHACGKHDPTNLFNTCCPFNQIHGINRDLLLSLLKNEDPDFTIHRPSPIRAEDPDEGKDPG